MGIDRGAAQEIVKQCQPNLNFASPIVTLEAAFDERD